MNSPSCPISALSPSSQTKEHIPLCHLSEQVHCTLQPLLGPKASPKPRVCQCEAHTSHLQTTAEISSQNSKASGTIIAKPIDAVISDPRATLRTRTATPVSKPTPAKIAWSGSENAKFGCDLAGPVLKPKLLYDIRAVLVPHSVSMSMCYTR
jgi:hypothetical protein